MGDPAEDFKSLPLPDRFVHKLWKVRKEAYEDAAKEFEKTADESDPVFKPFLQDPSLWKGAAGDTNVAAQQDGVAALCSFLQYGGTQACIKTRSLTITPIVEKGLAAARPAAKAKSLEALLLYIELDKPDPIIEELLPSLSHKQPKIIAATLSALTSIYHAYGCKTIDPKPVLKALPKAFAHADKNVRAEASNLTVELYRWLKEAMKAIFWGELKPVQQNDLDAQFEKVKQEPPPQQERYLKSQQEAMAAAAETGGDEAAGGEPEDGEDGGELDEFSLAEPKDVIAAAPKDFHERLASSKWKDRKEALDELYAVINVPRIQEGPFDEMIRGFAKSMKDANVAVVTVAANCVEALAKGLRKSFAKYRSMIMAPMMERLKEKKQSVTDALAGALDAVFASTSLEECLEEVLEFLKHKNPQVKLESLRFLIRCLKTTRDMPSKTEIKSIADASTKLLAESTEALRSGAAEAMGTLMKITGERAMNPYMESLDDIRKTKIKEYFEKAEVKAKEKPKAAPPPPKPAAAPAAATRKVVKKPALGVKKPAAPAPPPPSAPSPVEEPPAAAPLKSQPTSRGVPSKLAGPKSGLAAPGAGLKLQRKIVPPGGTPSGLASPKRPASAGAPEEEVPAPPKFGLGNRGLAGRPLGKLTPQPAPVASEAPSPVPTPGLGAAERAELEELRAEKERLMRANEELRMERAKLNSQINELQNQNAQLIEDHTRDVLSIKAKETQLVRSRSDAETAEQTCQKQQREIERLKRELSRTVRVTSPPPADVSDHIYRDVEMNGHSFHDAYNSRQASARSYVSSPSDEKENGAFEAPPRAKMSPTFSSERNSGTSGRGSPITGSRNASGSGSNGDGIESWKRAAEVTSQLKARIEQMKARQGLSRYP
ncbi:ARM repeat-containing protein [Xylona heveae TC161]|uniref:ARM repeat-containing protein n=1 Tax=Xylona heveae (strain CBS 132557 / TC161) TaxID=1328760 RepID=A0A165IGS7_XYLHT|nr:ARM repeat-containing protein [Xylona heveae TC161]KZF24872.1 ARM repeat-containing protein [Xylona heveae TC161]